MCSFQKGEHSRTWRRKKTDMNMLFRLPWESMKEQRKVFCKQWKAHEDF